ncbi:translation initiation factor IF-2 [Pan paniscus]|uniref:translation initiation factor IF-2 n=1 Tax=Pan paniscus TaxID=9597 RepID=UPI002436B3FF|nr:translation initiation factor IF-2 [Pan paniscus]XP_054960624.1 translation initiation factor IF-2 [Pan paniscus]
MAAGARAVPGRPTQPSVPQSFLTRPRTQPGGHERPCHARQPRPQAAGPAAGASVRRTRTGAASPRSRTDAAPASRTPPMQRPGRDVRGWRVLRECPAKPSYLGGLPRQGSQDGPPHTGGGGSSARPLPGGAGAGLPADWSRALMDSRHVPPPRQRGAGPQAVLATTRPTSVCSGPAARVAFSGPLVRRVPPKREHPLQGR